MKKYRIKVMYPGMNSIVYTIEGTIYSIDNGVYKITLESGKMMYLPINLTIIEEL